MKITRNQLRQIIKEERAALLSESVRVPPEYIEDLNRTMTSILEWIEDVSHPSTADWHPEDVPRKALEVIEREVAGFRESLANWTPTAWSNESHPLDDDGDGNVDWDEIS
tara:strand:+ start:214 stop:543 length:330 start_codon:yes stop_codon:yes gene_type:complete